MNLMKNADMTGGADLEENIVERRMHARYNIREGSFAGNSPHLGQIVDISKGGLLYTYLEMLDQHSESEQFVICGDDGCCIDTLDHQIVADNAVFPESSFVGKIITRQRRVKFENLSEEQEAALQSFIDRYGY